MRQAPARVKPLTETGIAELGFAGQEMRDASMERCSRVGRDQSPFDLRGSSERAERQSARIKPNHLVRASLRQIGTQK